MILKAHNLVKSYENLRILNKIHLEINEGESIAICGKSGIGKTTLLHILGALESVDEGFVEIGGESITKNNAARIKNSSIGFIFQSYNLLEEFTVLENVLMPAKIGRKKVTREKGLELLRKVDLENKADLLAKLLSGGEKQRVAIARSLCNDPKIILADEPTGNLDRENADKVGRLLLSLGKALILVTHDPDIAALCQKQYVLKEGQLNLL